MRESSPQSQLDHTRIKISQRHGVSNLLIDRLRFNEDTMP